MRVSDGKDGRHVVGHMGKCPNTPATGWCTKQASWSRTKLLMRDINSSTSLPVNCAMAHHIRCSPAAPAFISAAPVSWVTVVCVMQSFSLSVAALNSSPGSFAQPRGLAMPQERLRMLSRRGGSRGRAISQRSTSPTRSFTEVQDSGRHSPPVTRSGRGRGRGRGRRDNCEHEAHPTVRYRIPCTLAHSTFIVSVTIEKCEDPRGQEDAPPEMPADQRRATPMDSQRPVLESSSMANQAVSTCPSEPVQREPTGSVALHSDSEDSSQFGCRVVEEPYTTDDD